MATLEQMENALINADKAGDVEAARHLAAAIKEERAKPREAVPQAPAPRTPSRLERAVKYNLPVGMAEAAANMATGMVGKFAGDVAGLGTMAYDWLSNPEAKNRNASLPMEVKNKVQEALTYQPRTEAGVDVANNNPIALAGAGLSYLGDFAGDVIQYDQPADSPQGYAGNLAREAIPALAGMGVVKVARGLPASARTGAVLRKLTDTEPKPNTFSLAGPNTSKVKDIANALRTGDQTRTTAQLLVPENKVMVGGADRLVRNSDVGQPLVSKVEGVATAAQNRLNQLAGGSDEVATAATRQGLRDQLEAQLGPVREQQIKQAGQSGNLQIKPILDSIDAKLADPKTIINDSERIALRKLRGKLTEAELAPGVVDPAVLSEVRRLGVKPLMNELVRSGKVNPSIAAKTVAGVQGQIDDAMEQAGATGWRSQYMAPYAEGLKGVDRLSVLDMLRKQYSKNPRKFAETVGNENASLVKKLMNGEKDIAKVLPNELSELQRMADDVRVQGAVDSQANMGTAGAAKVLRDASSRWRIPNMLSPKIAVANRAIGIEEMMLNQRMMEHLSKAMTDPQYAAKLLRNHNYGGRSAADVAAGLYVQSLRENQGE